jgi:hypothetical protein
MRSRHGEPAEMFGVAVNLLTINEVRATIAQRIPAKASKLAS